MARLRVGDRIVAVRDLNVPLHPPYRVPAGATGTVTGEFRVEGIIEFAGPAGRIEIGLVPNRALRQAVVK